MAGFLDVLLRGAILGLTSLVLGGVAWARLVLRAEPHTKPAPATALTLRAVALAAAGAALAQACTLLVALAEVGGGAWPVGAFLGTTFARAALLRVGLAVAIGALAVTLSRRAAGPGVWRVLSGLALALVLTSAVLSHAVARVDGRSALLVLDALHQVAAAVWIGGLAHLTRWAPRLPPGGGGAPAGGAGGAGAAARLGAGAPRLPTPRVAELIARAEPLMGVPTRREPVERAWSEYNHHWAGLFVLTMGVLACLERLGVRAARHWPLAFLGLAAFLFVRNDPRAWPLGPAGFWESFLLPDVLQHRAFVVLIVAFAAFEWMVRTDRLARRPWGYVFPLPAR